MKGMIFAAGVGSRLKPWTDSHPKALVEVGGQPVLGRVIDRMTAAGISDITVNVHHFATQIISYLEGLRRQGLSLHVSDESGLLLDTGGGLLHAASLLSGDEPVMVHNADVVTDIDLTAMAAAHRCSGADVTLLAMHRESTRHFLFDTSLRLRGWENTATGDAILPAGPDGRQQLEPLAFGGIHIINMNRLLPHLERYAGRAGQVFSITPCYARGAGELDIRGWLAPDGASWHDVGRPATLAQARERWG